MWNEVDIERATTLATKVIGPQGRMIQSRTGIVSVVLVTPEHGKVWYGEISLMDKADVGRLQKFARALEMQVYVMSEATASAVGGKYLDITDAIAQVTGDNIKIINSRYSMV